MNLEQLVAVDVHVHVETDAHGHLSLPDDFIEASSVYFSAGNRTPGIGEIAGGPVPRGSGSWWSPMGCVG